MEERGKEERREEEARAWSEMLADTRALLHDGRCRLGELNSAYGAFHEGREEEGESGGSQSVERDLTMVYLEGKKQRLEEHVSSLEKSCAVVEDAMRFALSRNSRGTAADADDNDEEEDEFRTKMRAVSFYVALTQQEARMMQSQSDEDIDLEMEMDLRDGSDDNDDGDSNGDTCSEKAQRPDVRASRGVLPALTSCFTKSRNAMTLRHSV